MEEEENIRNLLPERPVIYMKEERHVSLHHARAVASARGGRRQQATMGPPATHTLPSPAHFLRCHHRDSITHAVTTANHAKAAEEHRHCGKRPPLPSPVSYPPQRDRYGVNWVQTNVAGVGSATHLPEGPGRYADTCTGTTHPLLSSGLHPHYVYRKGFGRVPSYLQRRKRDGEVEGMEEQRRKGEEKAMQEISQLKEDEKKTLMEGLHHNQRETERQLQRLPVLCETRGTRERRQELEDHLQDLSTYLHLLSHYDITLTD